MVCAHFHYQGFTLSVNPNIYNLNDSMYCSKTTTDAYVNV